MAEQDDETKASPKQRVKQGLHGWKAALAIFGCGSLAAFGVFGVLIGIASTFLNITSSGIESPEENEGPAEEIGQARSSLDEGEMNVCSDNLDPLTTITNTRQDDGENYVDTESGGVVDIPGASRVVEDECFWELIPSGGSAPWDFYFSYEAVIDSDGNESPEEVAAQRFEEARSGITDDFREVETEGDSDLGPEAYSAYGTDEHARHVYMVIAQSKSAVYRIHFAQQADAAAGEVSEGEFRTEARTVSNFLNSGFEYWIPDE